MRTILFAPLLVLALAERRRLGAEDEMCDPMVSAIVVDSENATEFCTFYPYEVCSATEGMCVHKRVFPVLTSEMIGLFVMPLLLGLASVAGLGGGVVFVPLMMAFFHFKTKQVVATSLAVVFESGFIRTFGFSFWAKHPEKKATEIDFNTVKVAYPLFLVGSYFGVLTSMILPDILLCFFLTVILIYLCVQSYFKGRELWRKEALAIHDRDEKPFAEQELFNLMDGGRTETEIGRTLHADPAEEEELYTMLEQEETGFGQWYTNLEMLGLTMLTVIVNFIRGTKQFPSALGID